MFLKSLANSYKGLNTSYEIIIESKFKLIIRLVAVNFFRLEKKTDRAKF